MKDNFKTEIQQIICKDKDCLAHQQIVDQILNLFSKKVKEAIGEDEVWETPLDFSGHEEKAQIIGRNMLRKQLRENLLTDL